MRLSVKPITTLSLCSLAGGLFLATGCAAPAARAPLVTTEAEFSYRDAGPSVQLADLYRTESDEALVAADLAGFIDGQ